MECNKVLCIIDADGLIYQSSKDTLQESINVLEEKLQNIFDVTRATHYVIFISNSPYFRHEIDPNYKSGRTKYISPLKWLKTLKAYLKEQHGAQSMNMVEADDLVSYWYNKKEWNVSSNPSLWGVFDKVICSPDKDLLQSIPGKHFNYTYKLTDKNDPNSVVKGWWVETNEADADDFKRMQLVIGDITDGISGIKGKGIKFYEKISKETKPSFGELLQLYCVEYGTSQGIFEFQKNYRLLHLLSTDEDFIREVGTLPELPEIRELQVRTQEDKPNIDNVTF